jgi:DNA-binding transcriptional MerR regulator
VGEVQRRDIVKDVYTISEFAEIVGVTIQTLRNWDKSGKLKPAQLTEGGNRLYSKQR